MEAAEIRQSPIIMAGLAAARALMACLDYGHLLRHPRHRHDVRWHRERLNYPMIKHRQRGHYHGINSRTYSRQSTAH